MFRQGFKRITKKQCAEFGQVVVLICILLALYQKDNRFVTAAFWFLLTTIIFPFIYYPFAVIWFGFSAILSKISSFLILNILFFILVVPVGLFRKLLGRDPLKIKQFKKARNSVMTERNHLYESTDLVNTF